MQIASASSRRWARLVSRRVGRFTPTSSCPIIFIWWVETPQPNLVAGMKWLKWFLGTYTSRFNRRHKLFGHLFSGRYKSLLVDGSGPILFVAALAAPANSAN